MTILIVDDDRGIRDELSTFLSLHGHRSLLAETLSIAKKTIAEERVDTILLDLYLGSERGTDLLASPIPSPTIMMSGKGSISDAIDALKKGAYDFLEKPIETERLLGLLRNIERSATVERNLAASRDEWLAEHAAFAPDSAFARAAARAKEASATPLSVLITGPSGSGKEVLARYVHFCSARAAGPFVVVNCAAIPVELAEAAFFGAKKGAYTGADTERDGFFQSARGGTLFLDELGDIPLIVQAKLLRAVENGDIQKLGSTMNERADVRIVCATNRDLGSSIAAKTFREDLYWRLAQTVIDAPGLEKRKEDIIPLVHFFLNKLQGGIFTQELRFDESAEAFLKKRAWPGNVRELRAFVERAAWMAGGKALTAQVFEKSELERRSAGTSPVADFESIVKSSSAGASTSDLLSLRDAKEAFEKRYVEAALAISDYSVARAAVALDILPNNLSRKIRELGISGTSKNFSFLKSTKFNRKS
ncbi:MAG: sigma-54 dependent transcriptional regulator [Treponemataceae bacterium]